MATYKLVFTDKAQGFTVHVEDENNQQIESLELSLDEVTPALEEVLAQWAQYQFTADQILDEENNVIGGLDLESTGTKH